MGKTVSKLTVFFEEPFWVGVYERESSGKYEACKITFGAEPKDCDVYDFFLENWAEFRFSPPTKTVSINENRISPKRMQRVIKKQLCGKGAGTKAQQALKLQQEQGKSERKTRSREQKDEEKERRFKLRQEKLKSKHRGH